MDIFSILELIGGLAVFLYGMDLMGDGLKKLAGSKLEMFLGKLTSTRFKGFLLGLVVTSIIQSSSATTVMLVGFVNSGIMNLSQTISIILGANIGTTVTAWLLSTTGINGASIVLRLLKPESFSPILAVIGVIMIMMDSGDKKKNIGSILVGFALLMFGMDMMSGSMDGLKDSDIFSSVLRMFSNPVLGIVFGTLFTAIIQSSSASVGILQALSLTGAIPYSVAIPIILGQNIGTTITPVLSSISGSVQAKRVAGACVYIKLIGVVVVASIFYILNGIFDFSIMDGNVSVLSIAVIHTLFNVVSTVILMPFCEKIEKLAKNTIKGEKQKKDAFSTLDDSFLSMPSFAVEKCRELINEMALITEQSIMDALGLIKNFDKDILKKIRESESEIDKYEDKTSAYLVKLAGCELSASDSVEVTRLLHVVGDLERISDHAVNIAMAADEMHEKELEFSSKAIEDINVIAAAVSEVTDVTTTSFVNEDFELAKKVEPLDAVIDKLKLKVKDNHIKRLRNGECTVEHGFVLSDLLTAFERVSGHCSNIAVNLLEPETDALETHDYLKHIKNDGDNEYIDEYKQYKAKYSIVKDV